jgi:hypothetical protein
LKLRQEKKNTQHRAADEKVGGSFIFPQLPTTKTCLLKSLFVLVAGAPATAQEDRTVYEA